MREKRKQETKMSPEKKEGKKKSPPPVTKPIDFYRYCHVSQKGKFPAGGGG